MVCATVWEENPHKIEQVNAAMWEFSNANEVTLHLRHGAGEKLCT